MPVTIIAEIGQNHNGNMDIAERLISLAKESEADIVKFQLYDVDKIFTPDFKWYRETKQAQLTKEQFFYLANQCDRIGMEWMASVFDLERFDWTEEINMKRYKIASRSIYDKELIGAIASTGKDMIVSLGMYKEEGFPAIKTSGRVDYLYCISKYPTMPEDLNFLDVDFNRYSGFSDHSIGIEAAIIALSRGAKIIEKHFTLEKNMHGPDHKNSMEASELKELVRHAKKIEKILKNR